MAQIFRKITSDSSVVMKIGGEGEDKQDTKNLILAY
jgi:hypothetical protein